MSLIAEVISIGDELTTGQRLDTNSQWISQRLGDLGVKVHYHTTVGDSMADNVQAFRIAASRADIVIASGGLGPTADDLTREAMAIAFHAPLELRAEALQHIESLFAQRKRPMPERNRVQAFFPRGSRIVDNPHGSAPGIDLIVSRSERTSQAAGSGEPSCSTGPGSGEPSYGAGAGGPEPASACRFFALPGVPAEMFQMYLETVEPRLIQELGAGTTRWYYHSLKLFGIGESDVEKQLPDLIARDREPLVGITVSKATITLRIAARCESQDQFDELIRPTVEEIREKLGLLIFGSGEMELQQAIVSLLDTSNLRLGVIEVGAGSWITQLLSQESAERETSLRAARWYATMERLESSLTQVSTSSESNCDAEDLAADGQASTMAKTLMRAAEQLMAAESLDVCLAVGCYPMHSQVFASKSLPTADFTMALARLGKSSTHTSVSLGGHPDVIYYRLAKTGLNFLRLELLRTAKSEPRE